jgi:purine-nucleoside phosphorylase
LERLIVSGAKKIILLGFCGSLNPEFKIMNVVSISKAFAEEGTSKHYFPRKRIFNPSSTLKKGIEGILHDSKLPFLTGSLVSTDAPYRETKSWLKQKQKRGIDLVDMEASAVLAIAKFYGIQAAALTIISDELWSGTWNKEFLSSELEEKMKKYFAPLLHFSL